jgi:hypothetical protein
LHPVVCHDVEKRVDVSTPGPTGTLCGNHSGRAALRREPLESNHCVNLATEEEGETNHRRKHSLRKRRSGGTPVGHSGQIALMREQCSM